MRAITDDTAVEHYRRLAREMVLPQSEYEFDPRWVRGRGWSVVPVESAMRLPTGDVPRIASRLKAAGFGCCLVVVTEAGYLEPLSASNRFLGDLATCYSVSVDETDLQAINRQLGPFRFLLAGPDCSWAISCNESYNLFGGPRDLVEGLLGESIEEAEGKFLEFALLSAHGDSTHPLLAVARKYAA